MVPAITLHALVPGSTPRSRTAGTASSSTSSRTSRRSSTSEAPGAPRPGEGSLAGRLAGWVRLAHPFPSLLDGVVTAASRSSPRATCPRPSGSALSMTALQASIGTLNDLVDAAARRRPQAAKPIPAGLVSRRRGPRRRAWSPRPLGLVLAAPSGAGRRGPRRGHPRDRLRLRPPPQGHRLVVAALRGRDPAAARLRLARGRRVAARRSWAVSSPPPCSPAPRSRSPTPGPTSSGTGPRASPPWRPRWAPSARGGSPLGLVVAILAVAAGAGAGRRGRRIARRPSPWSGSWPAPVLLLGGAGVGYRAGAPGAANGPGSSRRSGSPCWRSAGWASVSRPALSRQAPGVVAPDHRDRVLEPELRDRQVLGEVRPVGVRDRCRTPGSRSTSTSSSTASASCCFALTSESSPRGCRAPATSPRPPRPASAQRARSMRPGAAASTATSIGVGHDVVGRRPRPPAFDLVAQLDQGQLAAGDLLGQPPALPRVLDLHQLVGVRQGVFAQGHQLADLGRRVGQAQAVLEVALVLAELLGQLADAVAVLADHAVVHRRLVERREVLALEVLDDRDLERRVVVDLLDRAPGSSSSPASRRRAPAALAGDQLERACRRAVGRGSAGGRRARGSRRPARRASPGRTRAAAARGSARCGRSATMRTPTDADRPVGARAG